MNGYELSRNWFDWSFENTDLISPTHTAIYFFAIDHCNRLGWKEKFSFPTHYAMDAIGIKKAQTFTKHLEDLVEWGFIKMIEKSKNQYTANIISIQDASPKNGKALDKALVKHGAKQSQSTGQSKVPINKHINNKHKNNKTINRILENGEVFKFKSNLDNVDYKGLEDQVKNWLVYKETEKKDYYKTSQSTQVMINQLHKLSNGNPEKATEIVEYSIAGHYKGLFAPSQNNWKPSSYPQQPTNETIRYKVEYYNIRWPETVRICTENEFEQISQGNPEESYVVVRKFKY